MQSIQGLNQDRLKNTFPGYFMLNSLFFELFKEQIFQLNLLFSLKFILFFVICHISEETEQIGESI